MEKDRRPIASFFKKTAALARAARIKTVKAFDSSIVSHILKRSRESIPYIKNNIVGVFLLTFGIYSALISFFKLQYDFDSQIIDIYVAVCAALVSLPLLFSKGTIVTMLTYTQTGRVICESVGIRLHINLAGKPVGRSNIAFLLGMLLGTVTFVYSPLVVLGFVLSLVVIGIVMTYPEAAALIAATILPVGNWKMFSSVIILGMVSFFIKVFRGKRSVSFYHHRAVVVILWFVILAAEIFSGDFRFAFMMCAFFLVCASDGQSNRAERILSSALVSVSCVCTVCIAFDLVSAFLEIESDLSFFNIPAIVLMCASLIPLGVSFMISRSGMPHKTAFLCALAMMGFVIYQGYYIYMIVSLASVVLWLFFYRRRASYVVFALSCAAYAAWVWFGGSNRIAVNNIVNFMKEINIASDKGLIYVLVGGNVNSNFGTSDSFLGAVISAIGVFGAAILISFIVMLFVFILRGKYRKGVKSNQDAYMRALAPAACVMVLFLCGLGINVWEYSEVFVLFWILVGAASSIASDAEKKSHYNLNIYRDNMDKTSAEIII